MAIPGKIGWFVFSCNVESLNHIIHINTHSNSMWFMLLKLDIYIWKFLICYFEPKQLSCIFMVFLCKHPIHFSFRLICSSFYYVAAKSIFKCNLTYQDLIDINPGITGYFIIMSFQYLNLSLMFIEQLSVLYFLLLIKICF